MKKENGERQKSCLPVLLLYIMHLNESDLVTENGGGAFEYRNHCKAVCHIVPAGFRNCGDKHLYGNIRLEAFNESVPYFEELSDSKDADYLQQIKDSGVEVIDVNVAEWQEACSSVYDKYGTEFADTIAAIKATEY